MLRTNDPRARRVLLVGDSHGDYGFWHGAVFPTARRYLCDAILQLGDRGYREATYEGVRYLARLQEMATKLGTPIYWIDGNHENHTWLRQIYTLHRKGVPEPVEIRRNIFYLPRGCTWEWSGRRFIALGGAYSIDKPSRIAGVSWWPEEMITENDVARCKSAGRRDVLVTHDAPPGIPFERIKDCPETTINRNRIAQVMAHCRPKLALHGHWHQRHDTMLGETRVVGLDCNMNPREALAVLDLKSLAVTFVG